MPSSDEGLSGDRAARRLALYASGNMMKSVLIGTSSSFGNMFSMAAASAFLPSLPMLPTQILAFLAVVTIAYLALVDVAKRQLARRLGL